MLEHCATFWNIVEHFVTNISFATFWNLCVDFWNWKHASRKWAKGSGICTRFLFVFLPPAFFRLWGFQFMFFGGGFFWPALGFLLREIVPECWNGNRLLQKSGKRVAAFSLFFCAPRVFFRCGNSSYMNRETDILFCICTHLWNKFVFCIECNTIYLLSRIPRNYYIVFFCLRPCISPRPIKIIYPSKAP